MLTGEIRNQIDRIWDAFWSGGIANPVDVIEQITYLLFLKRLDEIEEREERKARALGRPMDRRIFPEGLDPKGLPYAEYRWGRLKNAPAPELHARLADHIFPFLRTLGEGSTYAHHMRDARFSIPESLIARAVDLLDSVPMDDRDTKGDVYEYMLGKLATSGTNGQFRTPRHIIRLMVEMTAPAPRDVMVDPAAGTCGFLMETGGCARRSPKPGSATPPHPTPTTTTRRKRAMRSSTCCCTRRAGRSTDRKTGSTGWRACRPAPAWAAWTMYCGAGTAGRSR